MNIGYVQPHSPEAASESHRDLSEFLGYPNYHCKLMRDEGHQCDLLTLTRNNSGKIRHHYGHLIKKYRISAGNSFGNEYSISLIKELITSEYDLLHIRGFKQYNILPFLPLLSRFKPILVQHLGSPDSYPDNMKTKMGLHVLDYAHGVAALNREELENLSKAGFSTCKLHYLPNAVNKDIFQPGQKNKARVKLNHDPDRKHILYVGRITKPKNVPLLVDAMKEVLDSCPRTKLSIVGSGDDSEIEELIARISSNNISNQVELVGEVDQKNLVDYYNSADVAVFPSVGEGLGMVALEASACKTPFIGTSAHKSEIFIPGENFIQVNNLTAEDLSSAIIRALQNDEVMAKMADRAYEAVMNKLSPQEIYNKNKDAYRSCITMFEKGI